MMYLSYALQYCTRIHCLNLEINWVLLDSLSTALSNNVLILVLNECISCVASSH